MNYLITLIIALNIIQPYCKAMEKNLSHIIVNGNHQPTPALLAILEATNIKHDGSLQSINTETQKYYLRTPEKERWENQTSIVLNHENPSILFENLALIQEIKPSKQYYDHVLLLGATLKSMRIRIAYLINLWNSGVRFNSINILAGQRPLDKTIENSQALLQNSCTTFPFKKNWQLKEQLPTTETEMIKLVLDQAELPHEWNNILTFIDTPMQKTENGNYRRPNTLDTIKEWLNICNPQNGSILAISNQPFVGYQDSVLRNCLQKNFIVETVGSNCSEIEDQNIPTILDSLARWIYNEYQICKNMTS